MSITKPIYIKLNFSGRITTLRETKQNEVKMGKTNFAKIEIWKKYCKKKNLSKNRKLMLTLQVLQECQSRQYTHEVIQQHLIECQEKVDTLVGPDFQYVMTCQKTAMKLLH